MQQCQHLDGKGGGGTNFFKIARYEQKINRKEIFMKKNKKYKSKASLLAIARELLEACEAAYAQERCVCEEAELEDNTCLSCYLGSVIKKAKGKL